MRLTHLTACLALLSCGQKPGPLVVEPNATLGPPMVTASPAAGPFNGKVSVTFTADRPATIYASTNGLDPRETTEGRVSGESPFTIELTATTMVKYFASTDGKDGDLAEGRWIRAGGEKGTISGVLIVGGFSAGHTVGLFRNTELLELGHPTAPTELPFSFSGVMSGNHRLTGIADRNDDGNLVPIIDFQSPTTTVAVDLADPYKAGPENVRIYLGASKSGLGTLRGTIALPKPPPLQNLQIALLDPTALQGGLDPANLLQQLQGGYRIFTSASQTQYPYVLTDLMPGTVTPVTSLLGFGNGGVALNLLANPGQTVSIVADQEATADFAFGPVNLSGDLALGAMSAPTGVLGYGVVAARSLSTTEGVQAVLMPVFFTVDPATSTSRASYSGAAFRANSTIALRVFTNAAGANPIVEALTWVVNPFAMQPPHATVTVSSDDAVKDIALP
jgi:hypothetical protein